MINIQPINVELQERGLASLARSSPKVCLFKALSYRSSRFAVQSINIKICSQLKILISSHYAFSISFICTSISAALKQTSSVLFYF
jgi:hypothetical protein